MTMPEPSYETKPPEEWETVRRPPMPPEVVGALVIASLFIGGQLLKGIGDLQTMLSPAALASAGIGGLIIAGFVTGHRLAWQWGRLIGLLFGSFFTFISVMAALAPHAPGVLIWIMVVVSSLLIVMGVLLGRPKARAYFGLVCPECGSSKVAANDFLFNAAKCKKCGNIW